MCGCIIFKIKVINFSQCINGGLQSHLQLDVSNILFYFIVCSVCLFTTFYPWELAKQSFVVLGYNDNKDESESKHAESHSAVALLHVHDAVDFL